MPAPADRVAIANALLDEEVIEQPNDRDSQLQRGVRRPSTRANRDHVRATASGALSQIAHVRGDLAASNRGDV